MAKIKILFTIPNFDTAGSGKVVYDLVKGLDKEKFEVEVACSSNRGTFFKEMESLGIPIHIFETTTSYHPFSNLISRIKTIKVFFRKKSFVGPNSTSYIEKLYVGKIGLTGLWFTEHYDKTDIEETNKLDIYYAKNQNIWLDLEIIGKTFANMFD